MGRRWSWEWGFWSVVGSLILICGALAVAVLVGCAWGFGIGMDGGGLQCFIHIVLWGSR